MSSGIGPALGSAAMKTAYFGNRQSNTVLIQMVDARDLSLMEREFDLIRSRTKERDFLFAAAQVHDWNRDLSPWPAPPVYGAEDFGGGAAATLSCLLEEVVFPLQRADRRFYLGGYSLAGLFALWAAYQTDVFSGTAAVSPSVWFPGFREYAAENRPRTNAVYLSLGTKEEKTRHPVMAQVGRAIRDIHGQLERTGTVCALEWNEGNHFREPEKRMAKGFAWLLAQSVRGEHG